MTDRARWLVDTAWLAERLEDPDVVVLDGSWHLPPEQRDGAMEFLDAHIPGANFFNVDTIADTSSGLPHMLPPPGLFAERVGAMGIGNATRVVVYDTKGLFSAPRVWWTFRAMGHDNVVVLDGGLRKWRAEGRTLEQGFPGVAEPKLFVPRPVLELISSRAEVLAALGDAQWQIVDARPAGRFAGRDPEPRPGLAAGHMPGARNVPFTELINADGTIKDQTGLQAAFAAAGVTDERPLIATCGSGMTAAMLVFARALTGDADARVYDGAWAEWGQDANLPVATGT